MESYTLERTYTIIKINGKYHLQLITKSHNKTGGSFHEFDLQEMVYTSETGKNSKSLFVVYE